MAEINVQIKDIETDSTGQMVTLILDAMIGGKNEEVRVNEMVGNFQGMTDTEVRQHFEGILQDVLRQKIGEKEELNTKRVWKRAQKFIGDTYVIDTAIEPESLTIDGVPYAVFLRDSDDKTKLRKLIIRSGKAEILESSLEERANR